jgi:RNA polymerase-interacting CarD/CdnL/TRCF family regulator
MERSTVLDRAGVAAAIRAVQKRSKNNRALQKAIKDYKRTVGKGGRVFALSPLIRQVNQLADTNNEYGKRRIAEPDRNTENAQTQLDARREQGKRDNQTINRDLFRAVAADENISDTDRVIAQAALDKLNKNLGLYPAEQAQKILDDVLVRASSPYVGMTYVKPYVDRVIQQQSEDQ